MPVRFHAAIALEKNLSNKVSILQRNYLLVYAFAILGDWLQGPYLYALYDSYELRNVGWKYKIDTLFSENRQI